MSSSENENYQSRNYNTPRRYGGESSSHGKHSPFSAVIPLTTTGVSSPTTSGASSAFGLGSGAFASFGSSTKTPKSPGNALDFANATAPGASTTPPEEKREKESSTKITSKASS